MKLSVLSKATFGSVGNLIYPVDGISSLVIVGAIATGTIAFSAASSASITSYYQSFESLLAADPDSTLDDSELDNDGWNIYGAAYDGSAPYPGTFLYQYGWWESCCGHTPNGGPSFSAVVDDTTNKFLNVYSDYSNGNHGDTTTPYDVIYADVLREYLITADDIGKLIAVSFDARRPEVDAVGVDCTNPCTADAYIRTLDGGLITNFRSEDMSAIAQGTWTSFTMNFNLSDASLVGQSLQIGFSNWSSQGDNTSVNYDNISISASTIPIPTAAWLFGSGLLGLVAYRRKR